MKLSTLLFLLLLTFNIQTINALNIQAPAYLLFDYKTGAIILEKNKHQRREIASLTKLMTAYIILNEIKQGRLQFYESVRISHKADAARGSSLGLQENSISKIKNLLRGLIIRSGNDAAIALAEHIAKTEAQFVLKMNQTAKRLKMTNTHFVNSNGYPSKKKQYSTASDMGILTQKILSEFPEYYHDIFSAPYYNQYRNRNLLVVQKYADGLKTGYTRRAGYCLIASKIDKKTRFISILLGAKSKRLSTKESKRLLAYGFNNYETVTFYKGQSVITNIPVKGGKQKTVPVGLQYDLKMTLKKGIASEVTPIFSFSQNKTAITAPIQKNQVVGFLHLQHPQKFKNQQWEMIALKAIPKGNLWDRFKQLW